MGDNLVLVRASITKKEVNKTCCNVSLVALKLCHLNVAWVAVVTSSTIGKLELYNDNWTYTFPLHARFNIAQRIKKFSVDEIMNTC